MVRIDELHHGHDTETPLILPIASDERFGECEVSLRFSFLRSEEETVAHSPVVHECDLRLYQRHPLLEIHFCIADDESPDYAFFLVICRCRCEERSPIAFGYLLGDLLERRRADPYHVRTSRYQFHREVPVAGVLESEESFPEVHRQSEPHIEIWMYRCTYVIVSVSRRTDVPAFHFEWFMNRVREGYAMVRNPVCHSVVYRVPLGPSDVDMFAFISKDPRPAIPHLQGLMSKGYGITFQVTVNPYGKDLEPNVPDDSVVVQAVREISDIIGRDRVMWRYDPVIISGEYDMDFHRRNFSRIASELSGYTERCIFTFLDVYDKHLPLFASGWLRESTQDERIEFVRMAAPIAKDNGIELSTCCTEDDYSSLGAVHRPCLDPKTFRSWGIPYELQSAPVREGCRCVKSIDIGAYDSCRHDCLYCYANRTSGGDRSSRRYDPGSEMLMGRVGPDDTVTEIVHRRSARLTDFL